MIADGCDPAAIARAADALAAGELVAFATETVYGLGARADDDGAVAKIYAAKGRPAGHPLIVHVAGREAVDDFAASVPRVAEALIEAFWPGPLTVIVERRAGRAAAAAGGLATIGLRCPSHAVSQALLAAARERGVAGIAAPSANRFGRVSPTTAAHVAAEFGAELLVLDGGGCRVGIESTIVDCTRGRPVLLRPGMIDRAAVEAAAGAALSEADAESPCAPGTLAAHYAPKAHVRLMESRALADAVRLLGSDLPRLAVYSRSPRPPGSRAIWRVMPEQAERAAQELYSVLRAFDDEGAQLVWVEEPPPGADWDGIRDRLRRAAAARKPPPPIGELS